MFRSLLSARAFFRDPVGYIERAGDGDVVPLAAGLERFAVVRDPDAAWRVLVTDAPNYEVGKWKVRARRFLGGTLNLLNGSDHRVRRAGVAPALKRDRIDAFVPAIVARVERAQAAWTEGLRLDLRRALDPLSLTIAGDVLLSEDLEPAAAELAADFAELMAAVPRFMPPLPTTARGRALARASAWLDALISRRRAIAHEGGDRDLVDALFSLGLSDRVVRGELVAFLLAAVDEPPSALAALWYLLGRNPEVERRLHRELDEVLGGRAPSLGDEPRLRYLGAVVNEALRLFPPARHIDRCPVHTVRIGSRTVRGGTNVLVSPLVLQHDSRHYDSPSAFRPERWLVPRTAPLPRGAYLPFGAGAHACIGEPLARATIWLTVASVARRWRLRIEDASPLPVPRAGRLVVALERR